MQTDFESRTSHEARAALIQAIEGTLKRARALHESGALVDAQRAYRDVLVLSPDHAQALHLLGVSLFQLGDAQQAEPLIARSLQLDGRQAWAFANHGAVLVALGRHHAALTTLEHALGLDPEHAPTHVSRGNALLALGRYREAQEAYDQGLTISPGLAEAWSNRGNALRAMGRQADALISFDRAVKISAVDHATHTNRGHALRDLGHHEEAFASYRRALLLKPRAPDLMTLCGKTLQALRRYVEALTFFDASLSAIPNDIDTLYQSCVVLDALQRYETLLSRCDRILALDPSHALAWIGRGNALQRLQRYDDALNGYDRALAVTGPTAETLGSRGNVLQRLGRYDEAQASYAAAIAAPARGGTGLSVRALALQQMQRHEEALVCYLQLQEMDPGHVVGQTAEAYCRLLIGDFVEGWKKHEARWFEANAAANRRHADHPLWLGSEPLMGKAVLLHAEQGYGDTVQFCRYASLVKARGATIILEVHPGLKTLLSSLADVDQLVAIGEGLPRFDLQCPLLSLPLACGTRLETIPSTTPYLQADARRVDGWTKRLLALGGSTRLRIGLVWSGNPEHDNDHNRSMPLSALASVFSLDATFISLQSRVREHDAPVLRESGIVDVGAELYDFSDTAALIETLDLVISVDTAVAHLAGALGKTVWVMLPYVPDWRWLLERDDSPWYPGTRLFRQQRAGDWPGVIERVVDELSRLCDRQFTATRLSVK